MRKIRKGSWAMRERHEAWEGIHEGTLRLNWWLEMKIRTEWRVELKAIKRSFRKVEWAETKAEDRSDVTEDGIWEWEGKDEDSGRCLSERAEGWIWLIENWALEWVSILNEGSWLDHQTRSWEWRIRSRDLIAEEIEQWV